MSMENERELAYDPAELALLHKDAKWVQWLSYVSALVMLVPTLYSLLAIMMIIGLIIVWLPITGFYLLFKRAKILRTADPAQFIKIFRNSGIFNVFLIVLVIIGTLNSLLGTNSLGSLFKSDNLVSALVVFILLVWLGINAQLSYRVAARAKQLVNTTN